MRVVSLTGLTRLFDHIAGVAKMVVLTALLVGCGPKPGSIGVGVDANALWTHERAEWPVLKELAAYCRDARFQTIRISVPQDWPPNHLIGLRGWTLLTGAPEIIVDLIPWPLDQTESEWRHFVRQAVQVFPNATYLVGNEPNRLAGDAGNPERWAWFYRTFRDEAPNVKLIGPALGHSTPAIDNGVWLGRWLDAGASVNCIAAHPYDRIVRMRWKIGRVLRERGLDLPLWAVETSGRTSNLTGSGPAKHVASLQRYGWDRAIIHVLGGWRADRWPKHGIDHFVLFRRDGNHIMPMSGDADELKELGRRMNP